MSKKKELITDFQDVHKRLYGYVRKDASSLSKQDLQVGIMNMEERLQVINTMSQFEDDGWEDELADRIYGL